MKKKIITTSLLGLMAFSATPVFATESLAFSLNVFPDCTGCHTNQNASKGNLIPAAKSAYNQDKRGLSGLKTFLAASVPAVPVSPTCVSPQILDTTTNSCFTPVPVCTGGAVLNAAKDTCVAKPAPVVPVCKSTEILTANVCVAKKPVRPPKPIVTPLPVIPSKVNTAPVLNAVAPQWDAKVGELISIPLSVKDAEQDAFMMTGSVVGSKFSAVHPDAAGLPSIDFTWIPGANQVNKIFTITFQAKEKTPQKLASNKVAVKIRVWAAGDKSAASITKLNVITSKWTAGKLNLAGNVVLNSLLTPAEKQAFIAQKLDLTVSGSNGALVGSTPLTIDAKGNWSVSLPATQASCDIILQFNGQNAARTVTGCVKPVAAVAVPITVANNSVLFKGGEYEDDDDDDEGNEREHEGRGERD